MKKSSSCDDGDTYIVINGVKNTLTCREWMYKNNNKTFKYVIPIYNDTDSLTIGISRGKYKINNIKSYVMSYDISSFLGVNNLKIDKRNSKIKFSVNRRDDGYLITSIPYDRGFSIYVDGVKTKSEIVNTSFLGFKIKSGRHNVLIKYDSLMYKEGLYLSAFGFISFISLIIVEYFKNKRK